MIKAHEQRVPAKSTCFEESTGLALGIVFEKASKERRFIPYALLSMVDYNGNHELTFHFAGSSVVASGEHLEALWEAVCEGRLSSVREEIAKPTIERNAWVRRLQFCESKEDLRCS